MLTETGVSSGIVKAGQDGKVIFVLMCSFQKPEPWQPSHAWTMPLNVPSPEECELDEVTWARQIAEVGVDQRVKDMYKIFIEVSLKLFYKCMMSASSQHILLGTVKKSYSSESGQNTRRCCRWYCHIHVLDGRTKFGLKV